MNINLFRVKPMTTQYLPVKEYPDRTIGFFSAPVAEVNYFYFNSVRGWESTLPSDTKDGPDGTCVYSYYEYSYNGPVWVHNIVKEGSVLNILDKKYHWIKIDSSEIDTYLLEGMEWFKVNDEWNRTTPMLSNHMECVIEEDNFENIVLVNITPEKVQTSKWPKW